MMRVTVSVENLRLTSGRTVTVYDAVLRYDRNWECEIIRAPLITTGDGEEVIDPASITEADWKEITEALEAEAEANA